MEKLITLIMNRSKEIPVRKMKQAIVRITRGILEELNLQYEKTPPIPNPKMASDKIIKA